MTTKKAGLEGYHWWFGTVEDRNDPLQIGRLRVRILDRHSPDQSVLPTDMLPWATPIQSITSAAAFEVGHSPTGITVGSVVHGFFVDGKEGQIPLVLGTVAGIPNVNGNDLNDVSLLARNTNNINKQYVPDVEPKSRYAAKYPYNKTVTTESGHAIEIDDTSGAERIHIFHKSGSYMEMSLEGQTVYKSVANTFQITVKDHVVYVGGDCTLAVQGNCALTIGGSAALSVVGDVTANVGGKANLKIGGKFTGQAAEWDLKGDTNIDGKLTVTGDVIAGTVSLQNHLTTDVQSGSDLSGKPQA